MGGLVGRQVELRELQRVVAQAARGSSGAVLIGGEPGIGKTRLLDVVSREAQQLGCPVLRTGITEVESAVSWAGVSVLLDGVDDNVLDMLTGPQRRLLDRARGRGRNRAVGAEDVASALAELMSRVASTAPTLLVIDDVHWLDRSSAVALTAAIRANVRGPIAIVAARRLRVPIAIDLDRIAGLPVERLQLAGLSVGGVYELLAQHDLADLRRPDVVRIHELSGGNPLFAIELAKLHHSGRKVSEIDELDSLRGVAVARLDGLSRSAIDAARVCALLPRPTVGDVRSVVGPDADDALLELERDGIIACEGEHIGFTHPLRREGTLDGLGVLERRRYHHRIADAIADPEQSVVHRGEVAVGPDPRLAEALERIADDAVARGTPDVALVRYRRAEQLTPTGDVSDRWRRARGAVRCSITMGDDALVFDEAVALLEEATGDDHVLEATLDVVEAAYRMHGLETAAAWGDLGRDRLAGSPRHEVVLLERLVRIEQLRNIPAAAQLARDALAVALSTGDDVMIARARVLALSAALLAGEPVDLEQLLVRPLEQRDNGVDAPMFLAEVLVWTNQVERAEELLRPLEAGARSSGRAALLVRTLAQLGDLHLRSGDWEASSRELSEAVEVGDLVGLDVGSRADLAWLMAARGSDELAHETIDVAARQLAALPGVRRMQVYARRGFVHLAAAEWADAAADLTLARDEADAACFVPVTVLPFLPDLVEALVQVGEIDRARVEADAFAAAADRAHSTPDLALAARSSALVASASGDTDAAISLALSAIELHRVGPAAAFEEARTRLAAGAIMRRAGRRRDAREQVECALAIFEELDAQPFIARAKAELRRLVTRQASMVLSSSEQRVADLAASGRTNVEIARELSISVRTVESNLTRVYRKLGVRSRTELAARVQIGS
jgi:DNA-binding NarL/FixJ family response regulator